MACSGNAQDHCCDIDGRECAFLERDTVPGRHYVCGLMRELGSWTTVHADPRWKGSPAGQWFARRFPGSGCGDWPFPGETCATCGVSGG